MAVKYTTVAIVKSFIKNGAPNTGTLADADIEEMIEQAEAMFDAILKVSDDFTFDSSKKGHNLLRQVVSLKVALQVVMSTPLCHLTITQAAMAADQLFDQYIDAKKHLLNASQWDYIRRQ